ncbi:MAG: archease [Candidatus Micrarchaeia archaeon]
MSLHKKYRYFNHTADISFFAYGKDEKECFKNSAYAMFNVMYDEKNFNKEKIKKSVIKINEKANSKEDLLWFFLQKIITTIYSKSISIFDIKKLNITKKNNLFYLKAELFFIKNLRQEDFLMDIKAVTPHNIEIIKYKNGYRSRLTLDI